jgi:hypothetical protein
MDDTFIQPWLDSYALRVDADRMNDAREPAVTRSSTGTLHDEQREAERRPVRQQPEGERLAEQGWGPTLRLTVLILARGVADRIAEKRSAPLRSVATRTAVGLAAAAGAYAKVRGWW